MSQPPVSEPASQVFQADDVRAAIRAATTEQLRGILGNITQNLCHHLAGPIGGISPLGPDHRQPWETCQVGNGVGAGLQIYRHVLQVLAGHYLRAVGFDPAKATAQPDYLIAAVEPWLRTARTRQLRQALLNLTGCIKATAEDSDTAAAVTIHENLPEDTRDTGIGVSLAICLYQRAVQVTSLHVLHFIWNGLGIASHATILRPLTGTDIATPN